jgi:hypothetical protein
MDCTKPVTTGSMRCIIHSSPWVFIRVLTIPDSLFEKDCLLLVYVDDCLIFGKTDTILDTLISNPQKDVVLTSQGSVGAYLGIDIHPTSTGHLELEIISACGLQDQSTEHTTPANMILTSDMFGPPHEHSWSYRLLIGMVNNLASSTRPNITFAVYQCAHFTASPCHIHDLAIHRIIQYLKAT